MRIDIHCCLYSAVTPDIGEACDDVKLGYRKFPVNRHIIFYREVTQAQLDIPGVA